MIIWVHEHESAAVGKHGLLGFSFKVQNEFFVFTLVPHLLETV